MKDISSVQRPIWLTQNIYTLSSLYNVGGYALIKGELRVEVLIRSIEEILSQTDVIEIGYHAFNESSLNENSLFVKADIETIDLRAAEDPDASCLNWIAKDMVECFDVKRSLFKVRILSASNARYYWYTKVHHLVFDGYSMALFFNRVSEIYAACSGMRKDAAKRIFPYTDFIHEEKRYLQSDEYEKDKIFWMSRLKGRPIVKAFQSCMKSGGGARSLKYERREMRIPRELCDRIESFCANHGSSLFHYFVTTALILNKCYNNDDPFVGIPVFNRANSRFKNTLGTFVNMLPFSVSLKKEQRFVDVLTLVSNELKEYYRHHRFPLYDMLQDVDRSGNIYNLTFSYQKNDYRSELDDMSASIRYIGSGEQQEDISLHLLEYQKKEDLVLVIDYNKQLFDAGVIDNLLQHFNNLLISGISCSQLLISELDYLSVTEKQLLITAFNGNRRSYPAGRTTVDMFEEQVAREPDSIAVVTEAATLTYMELKEASDRMAAYLKETYQIGPDELVCIKLSRNEWLIIAIIATIKSGAAYVPIDPDYPQERINYILEDSRCKVVLDEEELLRATKALHRYGAVDVKSHVTGDDLAYVIYTSGSTGYPKGVMIRHQSVYTFINWCIEEFFHSDFDTVFGVTSVCFDLSVFEIFYTLCTGKKLRLLASALDIPAYLNTTDKVLLNTVPSVVGALIRQHVDLRTVTVLNMAGEPVPENYIEHLDCQTIEIRNLYGPSECTTYSTVYRIRKGKAVLIGKPISNTAIYILSETGGLLPTGVVGDIYISGDGLARGYLNKGELTHRTFIGNPFREEDRMYKTGDLGKWLPDGNIEFIGRKDNQVKIRGHRIEPGEIESVLLQYPGIESCVVTDVVMADGELELVAYVVSREELGVSGLKDALSARLPAYMLPGYFVQLDQLPLTSNGKIDRKNLPEWKPAGDGAYVAPRAEEEVRLAMIWQKVLNREKIGIKDNFFLLGGHSLKATRLVSQIFKEFEVSITLSEVFSNPILEDQALLIRGTRKTTYCHIQPAPVQDHYPLSYSQQRIWLMDKMEIDRESYNICGIYNPGKDIDAEILERAVRILVGRHEMLRTVFFEVDGIPRQRVLNPEELDIPAIFVTPKAQGNIDALRQQVYSLNFSLDAWPLFHMCQTYEGNICKIVYSIHHIISDGWSMEIFLKDLMAIYHAELSNKPDCLGSLGIQYKDYASWQQAFFPDEGNNKQEEYWVSNLRGVPANIRLPYDYEYYGEAAGNEAGRFELYISKSLKDDIKNFLISRRVSLFSFFIACFKVLLSRMTGEADITIGVPVANREHDDIKDTIGFFLNTIMIRDSVDADRHFDMFLQQVNATLLNGLANQSYPFEKVLEKLNIVRHKNVFPISPVLLNMLNFDSVEGQSLEGHNNMYESFVSHCKCDLECYFSEYTDGITVDCVYRKRLFKPKTIEYWMNEFVAIVRRTVSDPGIKNGDINIFTQPPFRITMPTPSNSFNCFSNESVTQSIVSRFEEIAGMYPDRTAIEQDNKTISYLELNSLANGLADKILFFPMKERGANIALLLDHGVDVVTGMLGVLKTGSVYVPLDPDYPVERLVYILNDTACKLLVVTDATVGLASQLLDKKDDIFIINISRELEMRAENLHIDVDPESRAYILYTSGSTGQPKGVIQTHRNVLHFISVYTNNLHIAITDSISLLPSYSFDSSVMDIYGALLNGASLYPYNLRENGVDALGAWLLSNSISIFHTVPTIYRYFMAELNIEVFENIRLVVLGGEAVYRADFEKFKQYFKEGAIFINGYGPTESTITMQKFLDHSSIVTNLNIPVGYPVQQTKVFLLNESNRVVGVYQTGEIVYKSNYLSLGYLNKEELTASVFIADPATNAGRMYRSGDLGRMLPTGEIEFIGRKDNQVKLNGHRIELSDIEQNLLKIEGVHEAVVMVKTVSDEKRLIAYMRTGNEVDEHSIHRVLKGILPIHMIPEMFVFIDHFPLTPTGKINRLGLPDPVMKVEKGNGGHLEPQTEMEAGLMLIWQEVLGAEEISVKDNFFRIGGNSLKALRVIFRIRTEFGISLRTEEIFMNDTIELLAKEIARKRWIIEEPALKGDKMTTISL